MKIAKLNLKVIFFFILVSNATNSFGQMVQLPVTEIPQKTRDWCWAASMEMIMKYHNPALSTTNNPFPTNPLTQCRLAINYYNLRLAASGLNTSTNIEIPIAGTSCKCDNCETTTSVRICANGDNRIENFANGASQYFDFLFSYHWYHSNEDTSRMAWSDVKREIDNCRPFIAVVGFDGDTYRGAQHAVVIKGYEETATEKWVYVIDPLSPCIVGPTTPSCRTCLYKMSYDMFNLKWQTDNRKNRLVGFIHHIYPKRDVTLSSCDNTRLIKRTASLLQANIIPIKDSVNNTKMNLTPVTVTVQYIDYDKMLNGNFGLSSIKPYLSDIQTQEIITNTPPQSLSQEWINGEWKTLIVRDLEQIPKLIVKLDSCYQGVCAVRLMNESYISDDLKVVTFDYVQYQTLAYLFYRFNLGSTFYLVPTTDLKDPLTNRIIATGGEAVPESQMITRLRRLTKAYEKDYLTKYKKNTEYTR